VNAEEARKLTADGSEDVGNKLLEEAIRSIKRAAAKGEHSTTLFLPSEDQEKRLIERLERLEYKVVKRDAQSCQWVAVEAHLEVSW
jgi:hypothetical protein